MRRLTADGEDPDEALRVRNQNRQALKNLITEFGEYKQAAQADVAKVRSESSIMREELDRLKAELQLLKGQTVPSHSDISALKSEIESVKGATRDIHALKSEIQSVSKAHHEIKGQVQPLVEHHRKKLSEHHKELEKLKKDTGSSDLLTQLQSKTELVTMEFQELRDMIYARGLLAPKPEIPEDPEEPPPVGAVALGEDVFTARFLIRLGFMKTKKAAFVEEHDAGVKASKNGEGYARMNPSDLDRDDTTMMDEEWYEEELAEFLDDSNVHGISEIPVEEGGNGYLHITCGWFMVCISTFMLQVLVVLILIKDAAEASDGCLEEEINPGMFSWWLLHLSKGVAIGVASLLMGRELMDVVHYAMVSYLVEPHLNWEVAAIASSRMLLAAFIAYANVAIFSWLVHPINVWINMTALAFIGELGTGMLDVARRGVFGHYVMKTMTGLNFELTFTHTYPHWFNCARFVVLCVACVFGLTFAIMAFAIPDQTCLQEEKLSNGTLPFGPGLPGEGGGGAHPHHG